MRDTETGAIMHDMSTGENLWNKYPIDELWFLIDDDNAVYEGHFYTPHAFTRPVGGGQR